MSDIDFQNGFLCGLAMKGLIKTGSQYEPILWNDEGIYSYFYIDFKRAIAPFSLGMLAESIIVYGDAQIPITGFEKVSSSVYKIFCDISNKPKGVLVFNRKSTLLTYTNGQKLPVFSTLFYAAGQVPQESLDYMYDISNFIGYAGSSVAESHSMTLCELVNTALSDSSTFNGGYKASLAIENVSLVLV